jgi:UDP-sulfoquinovose synthase
MKVLVIGGDGYLGWPTALYLANKNFKVCVIDNFSKRKIELDNGINPLQILNPLTTRIADWNRFIKNDKKKIEFYSGDILNQRFVDKVLSRFKPDHIVHYGEQPSAPYSMKGKVEAEFTQKNNILGNLNLIFAVKRACPNAHIIKLGTMGIYGTPNIDIEEGYIKIKHKGRTDKTLFPMRPHSFYHLSKAADSMNLDFVCRVWGFRVTDLHQGIVYGVNTKETDYKEEFITSFHYDHIFGTVLNRFLAQAVTNYPLTVYGSGEQVRTFLNIKDTLQCIFLSIKNPAKKYEYKVRNQFTEKFSIIELAQKIKKAGLKLNLNVIIKKIENPRVEKKKHYYNPINKEFKKIGLKSRKLNETFIINSLKYLIKHKDKIDKNAFYPKVKWKNQD